MTHAHTALWPVCAWHAQLLWKDATALRRTAFAECMLCIGLAMAVVVEVATLPAAGKHHGHATSAGHEPKGEAEQGQVVSWHGSQSLHPLQCWLSPGGVVGAQQPGCKPRVRGVPVLGRLYCLLQLQWKQHGQPHIWLPWLLLAFQAQAYTACPTLVTAQAQHPS